MTDHYKGLEESYSAMPDRDYSTGTASGTVTGRIKAGGMNMSKGPQSVVGLPKSSSDLQFVANRIQGVLERANSLMFRQDDTIDRTYGSNPKTGSKAGPDVAQNGIIGEIMQRLTYLENTMEILHENQTSIERLV